MIEPNSLTGFVGAAPRRDRIETPEQGFSSKGDRNTDSGCLLFLPLNLSPFPLYLSSEVQ
jgi:hypothetical protein